MEQGRQIMLVAQKAAGKDEPHPEDLFEVGCISQVLHDRADAQHTASSALEVLVTLEFRTLQSEILQGSTENVERIVDLVTQRSRHVLKENIVLLESREHVRDAPRQIAEFVPGT